MNEEWIILHARQNVYLRGNGVLSTVTGHMCPYWTLKIERARCFPSESAAVAVINEWGLEDFAEAHVICPAEE